MGAGETQVITKVLENHQEENRQQLSELRESTTAVARAVSGLATTIARVEERHARQDDGLKRIGKQVDDHEGRLRELADDVTALQGDRRALAGGWKVIAVIGGVVAAAATLLAAVLPTLLSGS